MVQGAATVAPAFCSDLAATCMWDRASSHVAALAANSIALAARMRCAPVFARRVCSCCFSRNSNQITSIGTA
jgi:hypothetical protein